MSEQNHIGKEDQNSVMEEEARGLSIKEQKEQMTS
jgi:hypothetical protein